MDISFRLNERFPKGTYTFNRAINNHWYKFVKSSSTIGVFRLVWTDGPGFLKWESVHTFEIIGNAADKLNT